MESVYSQRIKAGKRRTYFFDVRETRGSDYFLTITESRKKFNEDGYERHKIFLYKEDFNKFVKAMCEAVDYVKTELMPDFDFDSFSHEYPDAVPDNSAGAVAVAENEIVTNEIFPAEIIAEADTAPAATADREEMDKW